MFLQSWEIKLVILGRGFSSCISSDCVHVRLTETCSTWPYLSQEAYFSYRFLVSQGKAQYLNDQSETEVPSNVGEFNTKMQLAFNMKLYSLGCYRDSKKNDKHCLSPKTASQKYKKGTYCLHRNLFLIRFH